MDTKNFNTFNLVLIILIILGAAAAVGIGYYGLKEPSSVPPASLSVDHGGTQVNPAVSQPVSSSAATEVVWPSSQELSVGVNPVSNPGAQSSSTSSSIPLISQQLSGVTGNQILDKYLKAEQEVQKKKESYKEVLFKATIYQSLPLRDFIDGLDIKIHSAVHSNLNQVNYRAVFCYRDQGVDKGLIFRVKRGESLSDLTQIYGQVTAGLASWGATTAFVDLKNIFYPESDISSGIAPKFQETIYHAKRGVWTDKIRYANIKDQNGKDLFFGYSYALESVFTANSMDCLEKILDACAPEAQR